MVTLSDMLIDISTGILFKMQQGGLEIKEIDYDQVVDGEVGAISRPAVNISINKGVFQKVTMTAKKCIPTISLFLHIYDVRSEQGRRFKVYKLIEGIINTLNGSDLNLELQDNLKPINFLYTTRDDLARAGYIVYQFDFTCSFNFEEENESNVDLGEMKTIVNSFYLQDPVDDGIEDQSGEIDLVTEYGGNAYSIFYLPPIPGGHANTNFETEPSYGGRAESTY
jgi:hypothetical protein